MPSSDVRECSIARTLDLVGERWSLLALRELFLGSFRFQEIVRRTGAPRDILTARLRKLEDRGLIARSAYQDRPLRYEYRLTPLGESLAPVLTVLRDWGDQHLAGPDGPPAVFTHACGAILRGVVICAKCGEEIVPGAVEQVHALAGSSVRRRPGHAAGALGDSRPQVSSDDR